MPRHRKQSGPISALIGGTVFLLIGGSIIYFLGWPIIAEARVSQSWPSTPGKITVSKVESQRGKKGSTTYSHHIEYTYAVDGVQHTGNRVWVSDGWSSSSASLAKRTVAKYSVGAEAAVYYDPVAPDVCALQTGPIWMTYMVFAFGSVFFLVGALLAGSAVFKLVVGAMMIGAAATTAVGQAIIPKSQDRETMYDPPNWDANDHGDGDDGIDIT